MPLDALFWAAPVVVQPHETHWLEGHESPQESADKGYKSSEDWDCARDDIRGYDASTSTAEPDGPVGERVVREMLRTSQQSNEDVFCWELKWVSHGGSFCMPKVLTCETMVTVTRSPGSARP